MKKNSKRIAALIAVILLLALYIFTFVVALLDFPYKQNLFLACAFSTIFVPILLWVYIWLFGIMTGKGSMASVWKNDAPEDLSPENEDTDHNEN